MRVFVGTFSFQMFCTLNLTLNLKGGVGCFQCQALDCFKVRVAGHLRRRHRCLLLRLRVPSAFHGSFNKGSLQRVV